MKKYNGWQAKNLLLIVILLLSVDIGYAYDIRIGVLANRGPEHCHWKWDPTAKYLSQKLPEYSFKIIPLSFDRIAAAVEKGEIDFLITNPSIFVDFEVTYGISRIATLRNRFAPVYPLFGGVIFSKADNSEISSIKDLVGKRVAAVDPTSLGGWLAALREFKKGGIDPSKDFPELKFTGNHESVVDAVFQRQVDVGTANTTEFAQLIQSGKIKPQDFRIIIPPWIDPSKKNFPFPISTRLYPDWPFSKLRNTADELTTKVAIALLDMPREGEAARAAESFGWSYPLNYQSIHDLKKELKVGIYRDYEKVSLLLFYREHKIEFYSALIIFFILLIGSIVLSYLFRKTKRIKDSLRESEERYRTVFEQSNDGIALVKGDKFVEINRKMVEIFGYDGDGEIIGNRLTLMVHPEDQERVLDINYRMQQGEPVPDKYEFKGQTKKGKPIYIEASATKTNYQGQVDALVLLRDITDRKQAEEALKTLSDTDDLTGLYNRRGFYSLAEQSLKSAHRMGIEMLLIYGDLDNFKEINDTFGHQEGDQALMNMSQILKDTFRESDILGRLGGDEFVILAMKGSESSPQRLISRFEGLLKNHPIQQKHPYTLGMSIGMASFDPQSPCSIEDMLTEADKMMYDQKQKNREKKVNKNS